MLTRSLLASRLAFVAFIVDAVKAPAKPVPIGVTHRRGSRHRSLSIYLGVGFCALLSASPAGPSRADESPSSPAPTSAAISTTPAPVQVPPVAQLFLVSQYSARGITQSENRAALQAIVDLHARGGIYVDGFISDVRFRGIDPTLEVDYAVGQRFYLGKLGIDIQGLYADYPNFRRAIGASDLNYFENRNRFSYQAGAFTLLLSAWYSPDFSGQSGTSYYVEPGVNVNLPAKVTASIRFGRDVLERPERLGFPDWDNYNVGFAYPITKSLGASVNAIGTNIPYRSCGDGQALCRFRILGTLSSTF